MFRTIEKENVGIKMSNKKRMQLMAEEIWPTISSCIQKNHNEEAIHI